MHGGGDPECSSASPGRTQSMPPVTGACRLQHTDRRVRARRAQASLPAQQPLPQPSLGRSGRTRCPARSGSWAHPICVLVTAAYLRAAIPPANLGTVLALFRRQRAARSALRAHAPCPTSALAARPQPTVAEVVRFRLQLCMPLASFRAFRAMPSQPGDETARGNLICRAKPASRVGCTAEWGLRHATSERIRRSGNGGVCIPNESENVCGHRCPNTNN